MDRISVRERKADFWHWLEMASERLLQGNTESAYSWLDDCVWALGFIPWDERKLLEPLYSAVLARL